MARAHKRTSEVDNVRHYLQGVAKNLADKLYGPDGPAWDTKLSDIENLCLDLREVLSEAFLQQALQRQADSHGAQAPQRFRNCPQCQRTLHWTDQDTQERIVDTTVGEAQWAEPEGYCPRCRRAFFPSIPQSWD